jgi:hypothetical protein
LVLRLDHLVNPIRRFTERHGRVLGADLLDLAEYVVNIHGMPDPSVRIAEKVQARPEAPDPLLPNILHKLIRQPMGAAQSAHSQDGERGVFGSRAPAKSEARNRCDDDP